MKFNVLILAVSTLLSQVVHAAGDAPELYADCRTNDSVYDLRVSKGGIAGDGIAHLQLFKGESPIPALDAVVSRRQAGLQEKFKASGISLIVSLESVAVTSSHPATLKAKLASGERIEERMTCFYQK